jgi:hypothetical protein
MARVNIPIATLAVNGGTISTGGTLDPTNDAVIAAKGRTSKLLIHVNNTGAAGTVSIAAGDNPPALRAGLGATTIAVGGTAQVMILIESARHAQSDGTIELDITGSMTGSIMAYEFPNGI